MYLKALVIIVCTLGLLAAAPHPGHAAGPAQLGFAPSASHAAPGATVAIDVTVADVTGLGGYDLQLSFDPAVLRLGSLQDSGFVASSGNLVTCVPATIDNSTGHAVAACFTIPLFSSSPGAAATTPVPVIHASFVALRPGSSTLSLAGSDLKDAAGGLIPVTVSAGSVDVAPAAAAAPSPTGSAPSATSQAPTASPTADRTPAATSFADVSATATPPSTPAGASAAATVAASVLGVPATGSAGGGHGDTAALVAVLAAFAAASIGAGVLVVLRNRRASG